jgi:hypothetical protein
MGKIVDDTGSVNMTPKADKIQRLAAQLLADRQRSDRSEVSAFNSCFLCGRSFSYHGPNGDDSGRFCSASCREAYDEGSRAATYSRRQQFSMPMGKSGFYITCDGCQREFESKGLRFCGSDCERTARERAETKATLTEIGMEPVTTKRQCAVPGCAGRIPNWKNGRRVSSARKYCDRHNRSRP